MKTLILWTDAFRHDYINEKDTPFLYSLARKFGYGRLTPSFGYSSGTTFYTGVYPEKHGQFSLFQYGHSIKKVKDYRFLNYVPDGIKHYVLDLYRYYIEKNDLLLPKIDFKRIKNFSLAQEKYYNHRNSVNVPTLFDYLKDNNLSYLVYNWPYVATDRWSKLTFMTGSNDGAKTKEFLKLIQNNHADIYTIHLCDLDKCGHSYGPDSVELKRAIVLQDRLIEDIVSQFSIEKDNIVIWSDHGMLPVSHNFDITSILPDIDGYYYFLDSTIARFWFFDEETKHDIISRLKTLSHGHILSKKEKVEHGIDFVDNRYGDEIFLVNPGVLIYPNFFQSSNPVKGMHGYDLLDNKEHGIFVFNRETKEYGHMVDMLPTILSMLDIHVPTTIQGTNLLKRY